MERRVPAITASLVVVLAHEGPPTVTEIDALSAAEAALTATYQNEDMAAAVERYADAGHIDLAGHRASARGVVEGVMRSAERVLRIRLPSLGKIVDVQRWLVDAIEQHLGAL